MTSSPDPHVLPVDVAYARWAATYDIQPNPMIALAERALAPRWPTLGGRSFLELGCGTGRNLAHAQAAGARSVVGVDRSAPMLAVARRRAPGAHLLQADAAGPLPLSDGSAQVTLLCLVLEHVPDVRPVLREARRLRAPGGVVWILEVHPDRLRAGARARGKDADGGSFVTACHVHEIATMDCAAEAAGLRLRDTRTWSPGGNEAPWLVDYVLE